MLLSYLPHTAVKTKRITHVMQLKQWLVCSGCSIRDHWAVTTIITAMTHWYLFSVADTFTRLGSSQARLTVQDCKASSQKHKPFALVEKSTASLSGSLAAARGG